MVLSSILDDVLLFVSVGFSILDDDLLFVSVCFCIGDDLHVLSRVLRWQADSPLHLALF